MSELASDWKENNSKLGVTSYLLRLEDHFLQLIEGPPRAVSGLMDRIWDDGRHTDLQILLTGHDSQHHSDGHTLSYIDLTADKGETGKPLTDLSDACEGLCSTSPALRAWLTTHARPHEILQPRDRS